MRWLIPLALLLLLIVKIWPRGLVVVACTALLLTAGVIWMNQREESKLALIAMEVAYAPDICPADRPLHVSFTNSAEKEMEKLIFSIHARIPGYSSIVTPYTYRQYESEKILAPGESHAACFPIPLLSRTPAAQTPPEDLEWSAEADRAWFR